MNNFQGGDKLKNSRKLDRKCYALHLKPAATTAAVRKLVYTLRKGVLISSLMCNTYEAIQRSKKKKKNHLLNKSGRQEKPYLACCTVTADDNSTARK